MKSPRASIIAGILLMVAGILMLLDLLRILDSATLVWPLIFGSAGVAFLTQFLRSRSNWWAAIPGSVFLGLAAVILVSRFWAGPAADRAGAFLFLFMGAGFGAVYLRERANWWALIPCGVMLTLALVVLLPPDVEGMPAAAVLFLGLAATFGVLALVPVHIPLHPGRPAAGPGPGMPERQPTLPGSAQPGPATSGWPGTNEPAPTTRLRWPLIPAAVLGLLGLVFAVQATAVLSAMDFVVPVLLVAAGVALLVYAYRSSAYHSRHGGHGKAHGA